jgi:hypothetical protein
MAEVASAPRLLVFQEESMEASFSSMVVEMPLSLSIYTITHHTTPHHTTPHHTTPHEIEIATRVAREEVKWR